MKVVVFGNSGSGKSTLAKHCSRLAWVSHLDLDTVAWKADQIGVREDLEKSTSLIEAFVSENENWVIEGCYSSLIRVVAAEADELVFLNPSIETCQSNCRSRPWESHKYKSKKDQDDNLNMLLDWVAEYETRTDEFSRSAHYDLFLSFGGKKQELKSNLDAQTKASELAARGLH